ncbi:MAG: hypothetical protein AMS25_07090 [Gemmatimonas sp. SM23_52]|nr:MAG: hypothetical protein AMS25_07090 [Gemmatimonas sp. SM23_52]
MHTSHLAHLWPLVFLLAAAPGVAAQERPQPDAERIRAQNVGLERLVELASSKGFHLVLEPKAKSLRLMYEGAVLREFTVLDAAVGQRRVLFSRQVPPQGWQTEIWQDGSLRPVRKLRRSEMLPPQSSDTSAAPEAIIPPAPDEMFPAPQRYRIRYQDRRTLEVVGQAPSESRGFWTRLPGQFLTGVSNMAGTLWPWDPDAIRLRVVLPLDQAQALYRSLPELTKFVLVESD